MRRRVRGLVQTMREREILTPETVKFPLPPLAVTPQRSFCSPALMLAYSFQEESIGQKGHRSFDTAPEYGTAAMRITEGARTSRTAVRVYQLFDFEPFRNQYDP